MKLLHFWNILIGLLKGGYFANPLLVFAQASHETGNFTSRIFKENKNYFGMKEPSVRDTTANGSQHGHALYKSYPDSVKDYILRQREFNISSLLFNSEKYMLDTFASGYAEDTEYINKWRTINLAVVKQYTLPMILILVVPFSLLILTAYLIFKKWF